MTRVHAPLPALRLDARFRRRQREGRLLAAIETGHGLLEVREDEELRWFTLGGRIVQSLMHRRQRSAVLLPNQRSMLCALLWRAGAPRRVLNLGFGIGVFERYLRAQWPDCALISVDSEPAMARVARRWFALPGAATVVIDDAADYVETCRLRFDLILCDIFAGEAHPDCLFDPYFHLAVAARLRPTGVFALNLSPRQEDEVDEILRALRQAFEWVVLAPVPGHGNLVVLAAQRAAPDTATLAARAARHARLHGFDPVPFIETWEHLPARSSVLGGRRKR